MKNLTFKKSSKKEKIQKNIKNISRFEALKLTQQILANAEQERLAVAEFEASKGIKF